MIFITYDTDHMTDSRMERFLSTVRIPGAATFFCTKRFGSLELGENLRHEIGLHPFFENQADWMKVVDELRGQWPSSKKIRGIRAHSCTYSQRLGVNLANAGYEYVSHVTAPRSAKLQPFLYPWNIVEIPVHYMDNMDFTQANVSRGHRPFDKGLIHEAIVSPLAYVFDFHPLHLLINSESAESYSAWWKAGCPEEYKCEGYGVRSFYDDLVDAMIDKGQQSQGLSVLLTDSLGE